MHELSLCRAIAETAIEHADGRPIERIQLRIGHLRQVVPETLQHCWRLRSEARDLAGDTAGDLAGCALDVDYVPAAVRCGDCGATTELTRPALRCGSCASANVTVTSGDEFLIVSIDVATDAAAEEAR